MLGRLQVLQVSVVQVGGGQSLGHQLDVSPPLQKPSPQYAQSSGQSS
jgi:hypothetical protein